MRAPTGHETLARRQPAVRLDRLRRRKIDCTAMDDQNSVQHVESKEWGPPSMGSTLRLDYYHPHRDSFRNITPRCRVASVTMTTRARVGWTKLNFGQTNFGHSLLTGHHGSTVTLHDVPAAFVCTPMEGRVLAHRADLCMRSHQLPKNVLWYEALRFRTSRWLL